MNYTVILYIVLTFVAAFGLSGVNFNGIIKKGKEKEARVLVISLSFAIGYLLTRFVLEFLSLTTIV
ncbi:MAG: DUF1146 family protein [Bacilli bacterium]|nr:DUF1146 family protein [Bacilli bacterium]